MERKIRDFAKKFRAMPQTEETVLSMIRWIKRNRFIAFSHDALIEIAVFLENSGDPITNEGWASIHLCLDELLGLPVSTTAAERSKANKIAVFHHHLKQRIEHHPEFVDWAIYEVKKTALALDPNFDFSIFDYLLPADVWVRDGIPAYPFKTKS